MDGLGRERRGILAHPSLAQRAVVYSSVELLGVTRLGPARTYLRWMDTHRNRPLEMAGSDSESGSGLQRCAVATAAGACKQLAFTECTQVRALTKWLQATV